LERERELVDEGLEEIGKGEFVHPKKNNDKQDGHD
jgi:hypothetical protein